jgi:hypothetical protein
MKKFVSVNAKYFKNSNAAGELGHVNRLFKDNVNAFSEYSKDNFGSSDNLLNEYKKIHEKRNSVGKKAQKNANTYVDSVMSFSLDQWEYLEKKYGSEKLQKAMKIMMQNYMEDMKKTYGFEPVGFNFHMDEGHNKNELKRNVHAHVVFYNYDFETKTSPLRKLKKNDFSVWQDMCEKHMKKAGFIRGLNKELTKNEHVEKHEFVDRKLQEKQDKLDDINSDIVSNDEKLNYIKNDIIEATDELNDVKLSKTLLKGKIETLFNEMKLGITNYVKNLLNSNTNAMQRDINYLNGVVDRTYEIDEQSSNHMTNEINDVSESFGKGKIIKPPKN